VVKSVTVPGKCFAISDGDRAVFPMKIDLKKSGGDFLFVNTFPPKQTPFLLDLSVLC
jgi:hypothetical protein